MGSRRRRRFLGSVHRRRALRHRAARPGSGLHCELSIRARDQRPDHGHPAVFAVRHRALAGAAAARQRISVHRGRSGCSRPDLSRSCSPRPGLLNAGPQTTAWLYQIWHIGFPASGARLCTAERQAMAARKYGDGPATGDPGQHRRGRRRDIVRGLDRHRQTRPFAGHDQRRALHVDLDRHPVDGGASQFRGADGAVVPPTAFRARRLAHGRDDRLDVRHRAVGDIERGQIRSGLLRRPVLRTLRRQLRTGGAPDRQCRLAGPVGPPARQIAPAGGFRAQPPHRARAPFQRGGGIRPTTPSSPNRSTAPSPRWNRAAERLFGYISIEAVGRPIDIMFRRTGARRFAASSSRSVAASGSRITKPCAYTRTAATSMCC